MHFEIVQALGYLASALVFAAFYMRTMLPLRMLAIASNVVFLARIIHDGAAQGFAA